LKCVDFIPITSEFRHALTLPSISQYWKRIDSILADLVKEARYNYKKNCPASLIEISSTAIAKYLVDQIPTPALLDYNAVLAILGDIPSVLILRIYKYICFQFIEIMQVSLNLKLWLYSKERPAILFRISPKLRDLCQSLEALTSIEETSIEFYQDLMQDSCEILSIQNDEKVL